MPRESVNFRIRKNTKMTFKLSILIPTLNSRSAKLEELIIELNYQIQGRPVQLLWLGDDKSMTTGEKRNHLLSMAKGDFVAFVDDDDSIASNYIVCLLNAIEENPDKTVICFRGQKTTDGKQDLPFRYDVNIGRNQRKKIDGKDWRVMIPDHLCAWRKSYITVKYPHKNLSEDHDWAKEMAFTYSENDQVLLEDTLYFYDYDRTQTECRR
jgi:glycosyltransferase involved in cell wall biosynthesis